MNTRPDRRKMLIAIAMLAATLGIFVLLLFSPRVSEADRFTGIATALVFGLVISYALLQRHFGKSLGRAMRASASKGSSASRVAEPEAVKRRSAPSRPFAYQLFDMHSTPALSPAAESMLKHAYKLYRGYVTNLCVGAAFLWLSFSFLLLVGGLLHSQASVPSELVCGSAVAMLVAFVLANPRRYPTSWTIIIWGALNLVLLAATIFIAIRGAAQAFTGQTRLFFLFGLALGALIAYGVLFSVMAFTLRRQVAASKPLQLLALWVFNSGNNLVSILSGMGLIWRFLGTIQFLRGGEFTVDLASLVKKGDADLLADTPEKLELGLRSFRYTPNWSGTYATNTLLCGDAVWKPAVHALLRNADAVAMSLFGFSKTNQGCLYELSLLLDTFPTQRVLFLIDDTTDLDFLLETLRQSWDHMAIDSPNHAGATASVRLYRLSTRFDRPLEGVVPNQQGSLSTAGVSSPLNALGALSATQAGTAQEVDCMLRLILEGVVC